MWISTKDRLPDEGKPVLARHNKDMGFFYGRYPEAQCVVLTMYIRGNGEIDWNTVSYGDRKLYTLDEITHWMEIPECPTS